MCWVGRCDVKIAKRDFYVYKIGRASDKGFKSLYQNFIYEPKEINKKVEPNEKEYIQKSTLFWFFISFCNLLIVLIASIYSGLFSTTFNS